MQTAFPSPLRTLRLAFFCLAFAVTGCGGAGGNGSTSTGSGGGGGTTTPTAQLNITGVSPTDVPVGSADVTLTVNGTGFASGSVVLLNGTTEPTTYVSSTQLTALVSAAQLKVGAVLSVAVNSGSSSVKADAQTISLSVDNPVPTLASVSPAAIPLGAADTVVTVTGTSFVPGVALSVNGTPRTSTFVSDTQLTAQLTAADFATARPLPLNVINPKPGGGTSGTSSLAVNNPAPVITALSPSSALAGSNDTTVTLTGTGLLSTSVLQVNGASHAGTYVSGTGMTFVLSATELASANTLAVSLTNPLPGGGASAASNFLVKNPAPAVTGITPSTLLAGSDATTLVVTGTGFVKSSSIAVNGNAHAATYVSSTEVDVPLTAAELAASGTLSITVANAQPGGGTSAGATVPVNNPAPTITTLTPATINIGSADTTVTVAGTGFLPVTTLQVDGKAHSSTYVNGKSLTLTMTAAELATAANRAITVTNAAPAGGTSAAATLAITYPAPVITSLSPNAVPTGSAATTVTITGTGFLPASTVSIAGTVRTNATYVSSTQMTLPLAASDLTGFGAYPIVVTNPANQGGASNSSTFTIQAKTPVIAAVTPSTIIANSGATVLTLTGTNLASTSKVLWNGTQLVTAYQYVPVGNTYPYVYQYVLTAQVPAELTLTTGSASITVSTPTAAAVSNALTLNVTDPPVPTITSLSPSAVPTNADAKLSIYGAGFTKNSVVSYNGATLTTTFVSAGSLTVTVPAASLSFPKTGSITVNTPAPGGGTSKAATLTVYVPVVSNNMVFNPVTGLAYLSIPSTGSTITGNSVVSFDPATGALGTPIPVGSEPNVMAVSDDGKTLWVALNGSGTIRKVDLVSGVAGVQYNINNPNGSSYYSVVTAMLVMPGTTDSVAVANGYGISILDAGVLRGATVSANSIYALQADPVRKELYAGGYNLQVYNYTNGGLTLKTSASSTNVATYSNDEMQLANGKIVTDFGQVLDSESGSLLGTLSQGNTTLSGATAYDTTLSKIYVLSNSSGYNYSNLDQVAVFNASDYSSTGTAVPWNIPYSITVGNNTIYPTPHRLTRWGVNGLMLHSKVALFVTQSNIIKDQSSDIADLGVTVTSSGGTTTGSTATFTATVTNNGPKAATDVALTFQVPSTGVVTSTTSTSGTCTSLTGCTFGSLAANATASVTVKVLQTTAGVGTLSAFVQGSTTDNTSSNNQAVVSLTVTGDTYNLVPTLTSISPTSVKAGSADTTLTVNGTNFVSGTKVMLGSTALSTTYVSASQLTATIPAANIATLGWANVSVSSPAPGGGASASTPFTIYSVTAVGINHIVYEPYSRRILAAVGTGSSSVTGNSVATLDPETGTFATPYTYTTAPTAMALSDSGQVLYTALTAAAATGTPTYSYVPSTTRIARVDLLKGTSDTTTITGQSTYNYNGTTEYTASSLALLPGTDNTLAASLSNGTSLFDYAPATKTYTMRGTTVTSSSSCIYFLNASTLLTSQYSYLNVVPVSSAGLGTATSTYQPNLSCFVLSAGRAYTQGGLVFALSANSAAQVGAFNLSNQYGYGSLSAIAVDPALSAAFYPANTASSQNSGYVDGLASFNTQTFIRSQNVSLNIQANEGSQSYNISFNDLIRWGQDGLALVTSTGHIYLVRGPFVVPQLLNSNSAATLTSSSSTTITHGAGNTLLTLTGSNFIPGVAVTWNGSYRTTTVVDATHVTVAIPASDLAAAGSGKLVATNPGAPASASLTVTVQ